MLTTSKKALLTLFFAGLIGLWWADYARIPTSRARAIANALVLPELFDVRAADVRRVDIEHGGDHIVLDRVGDRWELTGPIRAVASSARVEALIGTLKALRKSGDAGTIRGNPADFGLDKPSGVVRLFGSDAKTPLAGLELGKTLRDHRYARDESGAGIDLVDPRLLGAVDSPAADWRQRSIFPLSPIDVTGITIEAPGKEFAAERVGGRWEITKPARVPGDEQKLEGLVADLVALEVADGAKGFVSDDPKLAAVHGLETPGLKIEVRGGKPVKTYSLAIGSPVPEVEGRIYARRSDDAETVIVPSKVVGALSLAPIAWRSKRLANFDPNRVARIEVRQGGIDHVVVRNAEGWQVVRPSAGKADLAAIQQFLGRLSIFQAIDVREPTADLTRFLSPPEAEIKLSEGGGVPLDPKSAAAAGATALELKVGRPDPRRLVVNVQLAGDPTVLGLAMKPINVVDLLPNGPLGFRDRSIFAVRAEVIDHITIRREGATVDVVSGDDPVDLPNWKMTIPVRSPVDKEALGSLVVLLARMRADRLITDAPGDLKAYGLDSPATTVAWTVRPDPAAPPRARSASESSGYSLKIGSIAPPPSREGSRFAQVAGVPAVFTLSKEALAILEGELHDHRILDFKIARIQGLRLTWPKLSRTFFRKPKAFAGPDDWQADAIAPGPNIDAEKLNTLLTNLSILSTNRFVQYDGPFSGESGLSKPDLTIDVLSGSGVAAPVSLRIGAARPDGQRFATTEKGASGAAFLIPGTLWDAYIAAGSPKAEEPPKPKPEAASKPKAELPPNVFAP